MSNPHPTPTKSFSYTDASDLKTNDPKDSVEERLHAAEDTIADLMETVGQLVLVVGKDHPEYTFDWDRGRS